jgi:hypothetical protein
MTKLRQEDKGVKAEVLCELWREENRCEEKGGVGGDRPLLSGHGDAGCRGGGRLGAH